MEDPVSVVKSRSLADERRSDSAGSRGQVMSALAKLFAYHGARVLTARETGMSKAKIDDVARGAAEEVIRRGLQE